MVSLDRPRPRRCDKPHCTSEVVMKCAVFGAAMSIALLVMMGCQSDAPVTTPTRSATRPSGDVQLDKLPSNVVDVIDRFAEPGGPDEAICVNRSGAFTGDISTLQILIWGNRGIVRCRLSRIK